MTSHYPDEDETRSRLAKIRAQRGSPERLAQLEALRAAEAQEARRIASSRSGRMTPENSVSYFGHPWSYWFSMRDAGMKHIAETSHRSRLTTYADLWKGVVSEVGEEAGDPWRQLPMLLGYISDEHHDAVGAIPTAVVVYDLADGHPGPGFFRLAAHYGLLPGADAPSLGEDWTQMTDRQQIFWDQQVTQVFAHFL